MSIRSKSKRKWFLFVSLALAAALPSCGGESSPGEEGAGGSADHAGHGATTGTTGGGSNEDLEGTPVSLTDFEITPAALSVPAGEVELAVTNDGQTPHNLVIRDDAGEVLATTRVLNPGEGETLRVTLAPGTYTTFCSLGGHESLGMVGTLTAE